MKIRSIAAVLSLLLCSAAFAAEKEEWIQLFNGKDMTGWTPKFRGYDLGVNYNDTFRVENGVLKCSYEKWTKFDNIFGHLFYKEAFSNYRLRVEYRFVGDQCPGGPGWAFRNNGIMIHGQVPETMTKDQDFPVSIETQLLGGSNKGERPTANVCTPGTNIVMDGKLITTHCINSKSKTHHGDEWVTLELEVHGNKLVKHIMDGQVVFEYTQPQYDPRDGNAKKLIKDGNLMISGGTISLQAESHPTEFRKIEILKLEE